MRYEFEKLENNLVVRFHGTLDGHRLRPDTWRAFRDDLVLQLGGESIARLYVDFRPVQYIDSRSLHLLLEACRETLPRDQITYVGPGPGVQRLSELGPASELEPLSLETPDEVISDDPGASLRTQKLAALPLEGAAAGQPAAAASEPAASVPTAPMSAPQSPSVVAPTPATPTPAAQTPVTPTAAAAAPIAATSPALPPSAEGPPTPPTAEKAAPAQPAMPAVMPAAPPPAASVAASTRPPESRPRRPQSAERRLLEILQSQSRSAREARRDEPVDAAPSPAPPNPAATASAPIATPAPKDDAGAAIPSQSAPLPTAAAATSVDGAGPDDLLGDGLQQMVLEIGRQRRLLAQRDADLAAARQRQEELTAALHAAQQQLDQQQLEPEPSSPPAIVDTGSLWQWLVSPPISTGEMEGLQRLWQQHRDSGSALDQRLLQHQLGEHAATIASSIGAALRAGGDPDWLALLLWLSTRIREGLEASALHRAISQLLGDRDDCDDLLPGGAAATASSSEDPRQLWRACRGILVEFQSGRSSWQQALGRALAAFDVGDPARAEINRVVVTHSYYLPGSWVELSTGQVGPVLGAAPDRPEQPTVLALFRQRSDGSLLATSPRLTGTGAQLGATVLRIIDRPKLFDRRPDAAPPPVVTD